MADNAYNKTIYDASGINAFGGRFQVTAYVQLGAIASLQGTIGALAAKSTDGLNLDALLGTTDSAAGVRVTYSEAKVKSFGGTNLVNAASEASAFTRVETFASSVTDALAAIDSNATRLGNTVSQDDINVTFSQVTAARSDTVIQALSEIDTQRQRMDGSRQSIIASLNELNGQKQVVAGQIQTVSSQTNRVNTRTQKTAASLSSLAASATSLCASQQFS
jgi:hypothetical protein